MVLSRFRRSRSSDKTNIRLTWGVVRIELSTDGVVALLSTMHRIDPAKEVALRARLKHLQRLGFPSGVNTGRGRAARYGPREIIHLLAAFELLQLGMTPERAAEILELHGYIVVIAARMGSQRLVRPDASPKTDFLVCLDPIALSVLAISKSVEDPSSETVFYRDVGTFADDLEAGEIRFRRQSIINMTEVISDAAWVLEEIMSIPKDQLGQALIAWSDEFEWRALNGDDQKA